MPKLIFSTTRYFLLSVLLFVVALNPAKAQVTGDIPSKPSKIEQDTNLLKELKAAGDSLMQTIASDTTTQDSAVAEDDSNPSLILEAFNSFYKKERRKQTFIISAFIESMDEEDFSKLLPVKNRPSLITSPIGAKARSNVVVPSTKGVDKKKRDPQANTASSNKYFSTDSSLTSLVEWYKKKYDMDFKVHTFLPEGEEDSMQVARAVKKLKNSVVSVMIWNPSFGGKGGVAKKGKKGKGGKIVEPTITKMNPVTSVLIQESAFRSNDSLIVEGPNAMVEFTWKVPFKDLIQRAALDFQIDPFLIACLIQQESNFNKAACSVDSAMGLTQMIGPTAEAMGVTDPTDPKQSIYGGVKYLKLMLKKFGGNVEYALAAYNAGPGNVMKYGGVPPFDETRDYVRRIMTRYREKVSGRWVTPSIKTKS